ncbi:hypothetical protein evm_013827 [Chilo suppressalis]|nr:hypothetical protein evm_013827 [Chilo suppressalis]
MSGKTRTRSTAQQLKLLADYLAAHPRLAHGEFSGPQGKLNEQREWEELRVILNEHGPDKSLEQWKVNDEMKFYLYFKMSVRTFEELHAKLEPSLMRCDIYKKPICSRERLAVTIR